MVTHSYLLARVVQSRVKITQGWWKNLISGLKACNLIVRCSRRNWENFLQKAFEQRKKKPGLKLEPGLALIGLRTNGPKGDEEIDSHDYRKQGNMGRVAPSFVLWFLSLSQWVLIWISLPNSSWCKQTSKQTNHQDSLLEVILVFKSLYKMLTSDWTVLSCDNLYNTAVSGSTC